MLKYLIQGFLLGLAYVAPIGTQNMFMINTALTQKRTRTFAVAMIIALFDISLSLACFYGIGALLDTSLWLKTAVSLVGSAVVLYMGISLIVKKQDSTQETEVNLPLSKVIWISFVVTWVNPQAIIDGTMLLGASKAAVPAAYSAAFISGCALASLTWWIGMPMAVSCFQKKLPDNALRIISILCGTVITLYGIKLLFTGISFYL